MALARAVRARLDARRDPRDTLHRLEPLTEALTPPRPAPTVLPAAWQLAVQATVGSVLGEGDDPKAVRFDWLVRTIEAPGGPAVELSVGQAQLLALLVVAGEIGVSVDEIESLLRELDAKEGAPEPPPLPPPGTVAAHALRARVDQVRKRLAAALAPVGLAVKVAGARWRLAGPPVVLTRTPWALPLGRLDGWRPAYLRGQKAAVWDLLARAAPGFVRTSAVARALGKDADAAGCAYASKVVRRLRRTLASHGERWAVVGHHDGGYRIAPRLPARAGDW